MAEPQSNAPLRADAGAPTSGVIHVRTRLTSCFTVIANSLAQRPGSAVTIGVATYILSLPDGASVTIAALCAHFREGEILISRALRELEEAGYLERRRERGPGGRIRTSTYFYDVPARSRAATPPPPPRTQGRRGLEAHQTPVPALEAEPVLSSGRGPTVNTSAPSRPSLPLPPSPTPPPSTPPTQEADQEDRTEADEQAVVILASLRIVDSRLILSRREVAELAPAVTQWLTTGMEPAQITEALTARLPDRLLARPARILAFRLSEPPSAAPAPVTAPVRPAVLPWQTCDGCERAFRAAEPARCRDCTNDNGTSLADSTSTARAACARDHRPRAA
ncbi:hypothetical protein ABZY09_41065 [Streptomyces sp. NPDC002928]|uniref:hypothetical protein n=1 Tax=Streptomyces sp. NPDC002928 TaxID=3154440 RepID=UPI00339DFC1D